MCFPRCISPGGRNSLTFTPPVLVGLLEILSVWDSTVRILKYFITRVPSSYFALSRDINNSSHLPSQLPFRHHLDARAPRRLKTGTSRYQVSNKHIVGKQCSPRIRYICRRYESEKRRGCLWPEADLSSLIPLSPSWVIQEMIKSKSFTKKTRACQHPYQDSFTHTEAHHTPPRFIYYKGKYTRSYNRHNNGYR